MASSPREVAARAYRTASRRKADPEDLEDLEETDRGTFPGGEPWIEFYVPTRTGWYVRVTEEDGDWIAGDVIDSHGKEIAR